MTDRDRAAPRRPTVYVASKSIHGAMWLRYRDAWDDLGLTVASTWINEWAPGASSSMSDLWIRCIDESSSADFLVCWAEPGEVLKGALVEIGAALSCRRRVYVCPGESFRGVNGDRFGSWANHPLVTLAESPDDAIEDWRAFHLRAEWPGLDYTVNRGQESL